jgi:hypothetical protein
MPWPLILIAAWIGFLALYGRYHWVHRQSPPRLNGWWHCVHHNHNPWSQTAWRDACRASLERSKERRHDD